jgi:hypothetical protein
VAIKKFVLDVRIVLGKGAVPSGSKPSGFFS